MQLELDVNDIPPHIMEFFEPVPAIPAKNILGIPWMLAFALRDDGWYLREEIVWQKPSCLPESVRDRCTRQHETIFHLTKSARYYHDWFAIAEPTAGLTEHDVTGPAYAPPGQTPRIGSRRKDLHGPTYSRHRSSIPGGQSMEKEPSGMRNARSVWTINPEASKLKQFAMFPTRLASRVIRASTSDAGCCPACGAQYVREIGTFEPDEAWMNASGADSAGGYAGESVKDYAAGGAQDASATKARILAGMRRKETIGWHKACACPDAAPIPSIVLDPFSGAGTSLLCATRLGRDSFGVDLNADYHDIAEGRMADAGAKCLDGDGSRLPFITGEVYRI